MTAIYLYAILFVVGLGLIIFRPLARALRISPYWEIGAGVFLAILFAIQLISVFVVVPAMEQEVAKKPCGEDSPQGQCYHLQKSLCDTAWQRAESQCKAELAGILKERPSALIGPQLNRCRARKMDQVLKYNRANTDTAYCKAYFEYIEGK